MARPLTAARQVALAQKVGAQALAHGCTGKGNDQVRFELTYAALGPELRVIAPWREWEFKGREDLIAYVKAKGVPVLATAEKPYSTAARCASRTSSPSATPTWSTTAAGGRPSARRSTRSSPPPRST